METVEFLVRLSDGETEQEITVSEEVTPDEYFAIKEAIEDGASLYGYEELDNLLDRIADNARQQADDFECDLDDLDIDIELADELDGDMSWDVIDMNDYDDCSFAMEIVNGEIFAMTGEFQKKLHDKFFEVTGFDEDVLLRYCAVEGGDDELNKEFEEWNVIGIAHVMGYDYRAEEFTYDGISTFEPGGWDAVEFIKKLGYQVREIISRGPHDHGTVGVKYVV